LIHYHKLKNTYTTQASSSNQYSTHYHHLTHYFGGFPLVLLSAVNLLFADQVVYPAWCLSETHKGHFPYIPCYCQQPSQQISHTLPWVGGRGLNVSALMEINLLGYQSQTHLLHPIFYPFGSLLTYTTIIITFKLIGTQCNRTKIRLQNNQNLHRYRKNYQNNAHIFRHHHGCKYFQPLRFKY